jgi:uncharacterized protein
MADDRFPSTTRRVLRWRPLDGTGLEHLELTEEADRVVARSVLIGEREGLAFGLRYEVELSPGWVVRSLTVERVDGAGLRLESDGRGRWRRDGEGAPELEGCIDIDLSGTPFTNSLPIRRCGLAPGEPRRFRMAWVPLETLRPFADGQVYTRLGERRVRYQSQDGAFERVIETDGEGFVTLYPGLFERA